VSALRVIRRRCQRQEGAMPKNVTVQPTKVAVATWRAPPNRAGPALFPRIGSANPSLTAMALARNTAQVIVNSLQRTSIRQPLASPHQLGSLSTTFPRQTARIGPSTLAHRRNWRRQISEYRAGQRLNASLVGAASVDRAEGASSLVRDFRRHAARDRWLRPGAQARRRGASGPETEITTRQPRLA
jgi:hypothetical protein